MSRRLLPTPPQLFRLFEQGEMTREQLHAAMAWHARGILEDMVRARLEPAGSLLERTLSSRAAAKWAGRHGEAEIREIFVALSEVPDFPPANLLWNAEHRDVPLYCFFRIRTAPVFRLAAIEKAGLFLSVTVEHGSARKREVQRERFSLCRDRFARLRVERRESLA